MFDDVLIYDTESTDLNTTFGQITQFGGLKLDANLNITEELALDIRLLPWMVPGPEACRVTKTSPDKLEDSNRISEFNASKAIFNFLAPAQNKTTAYVTFNGISHDDEYLRITFYRNMLNPWFINNTITRIDLFPLLQLINSVDPNAIIIPNTDEGKFTYRLEKICPENGIELEAHDALHDAKGTRELLKLIRARASWAIELAAECGNVRQQTIVLEEAMRNGTHLWVFTHFGKPEFVPVLPVHSSSKDRFWLYDLRNDDYISSLPNDDKLLFNGGPFHLVNMKKTPLFVNDAVLLNSDIDPKHEKYAELAARISNDHIFKASITEKAEKTNYPQVEDQQSEEKLFPFFTWETKNTIQKFVDAPNWPSRTALRFQDTRVRDFAARILYDAHLNGEMELSPKLLPQIENICSPIMKRPYAGNDARWTTLASALAENPDETWLQWARAKFGKQALASAMVQHNGTTQHAEAAERLDVMEEKESTAPQMSFGF